VIQRQPLDPDKERAAGYVLIARISMAEQARKLTGNWCGRGGHFSKEAFA
jgi:hypothetical protein